MVKYIIDWESTGLISLLEKWHKNRLQLATVQKHAESADPSSRGQTYRELAELWDQHNSLRSEVRTCLQIVLPELAKMMAVFQEVHENLTAILNSGAEASLELTRVLDLLSPPLGSVPDGRPGSGSPPEDDIADIKLNTITLEESQQGQQEDPRSPQQQGSNGTEGLDRSTAYRSSGRTKEGANSGPTVSSTKPGGVRTGIPRSTPPLLVASTVPSPVKLPARATPLPNIRGPRLSSSDSRHEATESESRSPSLGSHSKAETAADGGQLPAQSRRMESENKPTEPSHDNTGTSQTTPKEDHPTTSKLSHTGNSQQSGVVSLFSFTTDVTATVPTPMVVQTTEQLLREPRRVTLATGWLLTTYLEQVGGPYPETLPRPVEVEIAVHCLPKWHAREAVGASESWFYLMQQATERESVYDLSVQQAHVRLALGLPLLILSGLDSAMGWLHSAQHQVAPALRHLIDSAAHYWQRTHLSLRDAGVLQEVVVEHERQVVVEHLQEVFTSAVNAYISYRPAAKVKSMLFPAHGRSGGLREVLNAVEANDVTFLASWHRSFVPDKCLDEANRSVNPWRDRVDYIARARILEYLTTSHRLVGEYLATAGGTEQHRTAGVVGHAREFLREWADHHAEYLSAIDAVPEASIAKEWLRISLGYCAHELGGQGRA